MKMTMNNWKRGTVPIALAFFLSMGMAGCAARKGVDEAYRLPPPAAKVEPAPKTVPSPAPRTVPPPSVKPAPTPAPPPTPPPAPKLEPPEPYEPTPLTSSLTPIKPQEVPQLLDDLDTESLLAAIEKSLLFYSRVPADSRYPLGESTCTAGELKATLLALREILQTCGSDECRRTKIAGNFDFYKAAGQDQKGTVLFTGYFEPVMKGSLEKTDFYSFPLYSPPEETVVINLGKFNSKYEGETLTGRVLNGEVVPHYSREEIDGKGILQGRNLEIAWAADPVELFFLHIQGSGIMELPDGRRIRVGYARSNGRPFRGLAKVLLDRGKITEREMSHEGVKNWLLDNPEERDEMMYRNPSYVFFRIMDGENVGSHNVPLTAGRSIATDAKFFPRGAPALIRLRKPVFPEEGGGLEWVPFSRLVLNQDAGGAIKGTGRVDIYCGTGREAERVAGSLKEPGELYFLLKKNSVTGKVASTVF